MKRQDDNLRNRWGLAWIAMTLALALHVTDEALTDFLPFYNHFILTVRDTIPWFPFPTFTFAAWLFGLIALIIALFALTPFVFRGRKWMRYISYTLGVIMVGNAIAHVSVSVYWGIWAPGVYSSPLVLATASYLILATRRANRGIPGTRDA